MNYLHPVNRKLTKEEIEFIKEDVENILTQEIIISQLSNGISYSDIENMDSYERNYIFSKLIQMKKEENDAKLQAIENAKQGKG